MKKLLLSLLLVGASISSLNASRRGRPAKAMASTEATENMPAAEQHPEISRIEAEIDAKIKQRNKINREINKLREHKALAEANVANERQASIKKTL